MSKIDYQRLAALVRQCGRDVILRAAGHCDGHSIMAPQAFLDAGLPADVVTHLTRTYRSDGTPKGTLFVDGQPVRQLEGVYGLDLLRFLAGALAVEYRHAPGRGFEAANIRSALIEHFGPPADVAGSTRNATSTKESHGSRD